MKNDEYGLIANLRYLAQIKDIERNDFSKQILQTESSYRYSFLTTKRGIKTLKAEELNRICDFYNISIDDFYNKDLSKILKK